MTREKMRAAYLHGIRDLRIEEVALPDAGLGEVVVKIRAATTCGTDVKIFQRGYVNEVITYPTVFGHEWAGDVVAVGAGVSWLKEGMRVRAGNSSPCLQCAMCRKGKYNLCEDMKWLWGAYAEYIKVPARIVRLNTQEIPSHLTYAEAAVTEPLACVLHGVEAVTIGWNDTVAIMGAGPIGLLHLQAVKNRGAERVIIGDLIDDRLHVAKTLGADETVNVQHDDFVEKVRDFTDGYGADLVIEAIGLPSTWTQALTMVKKGGTVLEFGGCPPDTAIQVPTQLLHYGEVTVLGAFHTTPLHFQKALALIASGAVKIKPLFTRTIPLDHVKDAFEVLTTSKQDLKIVLQP